MSDRDERIQRQNDRAMSSAEARWLDPPDDDPEPEDEDDEDFDEPDDGDSDDEIDDYNHRHGTDY